MGKKYIDDEIRHQSKKLGLNEVQLKKFIKEFFAIDYSQILKPFNSDDEFVYDDEAALPSELWEGLIEDLNVSYSENKKEWDEKFYEIKLQIICNKIFTKKDLIELQKVEEDLKINIKRYYSSFQNAVSPKNFMERFFNLPNDLLVNFVRFILNESVKLNSLIKISSEDVKKRVEELKKERFKIAKKIQFISNKNITVFEIKKVKDLYNNGIFHEDNFINRGVNEYLYKLLHHPIASEEISTRFNETFISDFINNIETSNAYLSHIQSVNEGETNEFFTPNGLQIGRKFDIEIEAVERKEFDNYVIDKDSIFKEPNDKIKTNFMWAEEPSAKGDSSSGGKTPIPVRGGDGGFSMGGSGGFSMGGGGGSFDFDAGSETVDVDEDGFEGTPMPTGDDGLPTDFGTIETNASEDSNEDDDKEKSEA